MTYPGPYFSIIYMQLNVVIVCYLNAGDTFSLGAEERGWKKEE
jgi:hypothetical protein